jgi:hypothetical protein
MKLFLVGIIAILIWNSSELRNFTAKSLRLGADIVDTNVAVELPKFEIN